MIGWAVFILGTAQATPSDAAARSWINQSSIGWIFFFVGAYPLISELFEKANWPTPTSETV